MRRALLFIILWLATLRTAEAAPRAIQWAKSFDAALAEAKLTNKLVMADFYAVW